MYELLQPFPVQEVDFKWSSGSKVNKRRWFLTEQADVLVKLENHRALHSPVLLTNEFQKTSPVNTAKKKLQKTSSSVHPCPTDVWTVKGVQKEDPVPILLLCSSITHLWPLLETNHCSGSVNDKSCFSPPTFSTSLQVVRLFYSFLFYSRLSVLSIRENYQNYAGKAYPKSPARAAGGVKGIRCLSIKSVTL